MVINNSAGQHLMEAFSIVDIYLQDYEKKAWDVEFGSPCTFYKITFIFSILFYW